MNLNNLRKLAGLPLLNESTDEYDFGIETEEHGQYAGEVEEPAIPMVKVSPAVSNGKTSPFVTSAPSVTAYDAPSDKSETSPDDEPEVEEENDSEPDTDDSDDDIPAFLRKNKEEEADEDTDQGESEEKSEEPEPESEPESETDDEVKKKVKQGDDLHETYLNTMLVLAQGGSFNSDRAMRIAVQIEEGR